MRPKVMVSLQGPCMWVSCGCVGGKKTGLERCKKADGWEVGRVTLPFKGAMCSRLQR